MTIEYKGFKFEVDYTFSAGVSSRDHLQPDDPDEIEITDVRLIKGTLQEILADEGWLEEIEQLIIENL